MSSEPTDRGTWRLVARRDFWVRIRERSFLISTLINIAVISILVLARASSAVGSGPSFGLGYVGSPSIATGASQLGHDAQPPIPIEVHAYSDQATANAALRDGSVDAVVVGDELIGFTDIPDVLSSLVQASARNAAVTALLDRHRVPQSERDAANDPTPLTLAVLQPTPPHRSENAAVAFVGVLLLYGQLFGYGIWVASGVIEEKASRVVEMLLSAIRPKQLLLGKIVGIGTLGLAQLVVISSFAIGLAFATNAIDVSPSAFGAAGLVIGWFILGFAFYATLFAAAGSLVTRMEELQNVIVPINLTILVSFFISIGALQDPNGRLQVIASILPTSSALAMPVRIVLGAAPAWQIAAALVALVGSTVLLVPFAARLYSGAVLRTRGRVRIREAWRSAD
ncbi:MAG: ABC transporter permease [Actinobacteria bacterium]|nr:MAG: ABC transporter permease [Actinomycetota bacterium]